MHTGDQYIQKSNGSFVSAYGSHGPQVRENSQIIAAPQAGFVSMLNNSKMNRINETPNNKSAENVLNPWRDDFIGRENASNIYIADRSSTCNISGLLQHGNIASAYNDKALDKSNPINTAMIAST